MPQKGVYEIEGPAGTFEIESDHEPTQDEILKAVRAYGDQAAAKEQARLTGDDRGSATRRFLQGGAEMLDVTQMAKGLYRLVAHPADTITGLAEAQGEQGAQAKDSYNQGRYFEAAGHGLAAALPVVGPMAAKIGEQIGSGDVAGGLGKTTGMLLPYAAASKAGAVGNAAKAGSLERQATAQVAEQVLAPGNIRYRGRAQAIAPEVLARKLSGGRDDLRQAAQSGMDAAAQDIDDAIVAAGGDAAAIPIQPIVKRLRDRVGELTVNGQPIEGAAEKVAALNAHIHELEQASVAAMKARGGGGFTLPFSELMKVRDVNYGVADAARGYERAGNVVAGDKGWAARETGSAIRQAFAEHSPDLKAANADYSFWKTLDDILDPAIGRPKATKPSSGITGGAQVSGAVAGNLIGPKAAFVMSVVIPWLKNRASDPGWQLADAAKKMELAEALKKGNYGKAQSIMVTWGKYAPKGSTSPNGLQMQPEPAR